MAMSYDRVASLVRRVFDARITGPSVLDEQKGFPNAGRFTSSFEAIRSEALSVLKSVEKVPRFHDLMPEQADISANDGRDWRMFILKAYGVGVPENLARCPVTADILSATPEVLSAAFSFLAPRKHIPPHRGPFRGIMRFHLILKMPLDSEGRPAAVLTIDGKPHRLAEGDHLLWDDTYTHEVLNASEETRAALLLDVKRPEMPLDMRLLSAGIVGVVRAGMRIRGVNYTG
ncbi:MAG: aspartyl/asparaginyl beta-hydroxylase domain-containing protein [Hyphomicrobiaceae bacterium]|nr:MAG: aspartyl/asparaginyl beta-hydroxylase domain-containing protein [Hyphomicrobiaceae bacterium]